MLRKLLAVMVLMLAGVGVLLADEAKGKVKKYEKGTVTVTVGDKDIDYTLKGAKVFDGTTEVTDKKERGTLLKGLKEGTAVTITFEKDGDKIVVKEFKITK